MRASALAPCRLVSPDAAESGPFRPVRADIWADIQADIQAPGGTKGGSAMKQPNEVAPYLQFVAVASALQSRSIVSLVALPTRRARRDLATSWTLSRFATDGTRMPSGSPTGTSVETLRTVEVTGAAMTALSSRPSGSRVRTITGRTLSRFASHTSPRRGAGGVTVGPCRTATPSRYRRRARTCPPTRQAALPRRLVAPRCRR